MKNFLTQLGKLLTGLFKTRKVSASDSPKSTAAPSKSSSPSALPTKRGDGEPSDLKSAINLLAGPSANDLIASESHRIGREIVKFEAHPKDPTRRTPEGHLAVVGLPANDGGGSWEIAGVNAYHPEARAKLRAMKPALREAYAAEYIETYARAGTGIKEPNTMREGTELFVLDCAFNRGAGGACVIVQDALIRLGFSLASMGGKGWGDKTRTALYVADKRHASKIITELRLARERYEDARDAKKGVRSNLRAGLVNRWNKCAEIARSWNVERGDLEPVEQEPTQPKPPAAQASPQAIVLPRESDAALNKFYGTATPSGNFLEWFNFPVGNVKLYSRNGTDLIDRDGDGNDEHRAHKLIVKRLEAALKEIYDTLGKAQFEREGWHVYAGAFNYRHKTSGGSLSTHSWGIAVDINPDQNGWKHYATTFSDVAIDIMEKHGFLSAYRAWGHDAMHFQAAIPSISSGSYYAKHGLPKHIVAA